MRAVSFPGMPKDMEAPYSAVRSDESWPKDGPERDALLRVIGGALKCCIDGHGPITHETRGSAAKRVYAALRGAARGEQ